VDSPKVVGVTVSSRKAKHKSFSLGVLNSEEQVKWEFCDVHDCESLVSDRRVALRGQALRALEHIDAAYTEPLLGLLFLSSGFGMLFDR